MTSEKDHESPLVFPEGLTEKDIELIREQCEHQHATSDEEVLGFAEAYKAAKELVGDKANFEKLTPEAVIGFILEYAVRIDARNEKGFRTTPVRFADFSQAVIPGVIEQAMKSFTKAYVEGVLTPDEAYVEFEKIHPFEDGNGRVGDLLWKIAKTRETGKWPEELPPDMFGEKEKNGV